MAKATIGLSLRGKPKGQKAGKFITNQRTMGINHTAGNRVIQRTSGDTGTILETYRLTIAVRSDYDGTVISGRYDEFVAIGSRFASHGTYAPSHGEPAHGYGQNGQNRR